MINSDICATCEFIDQNEGCEGCNDENGSMGWSPCQLLTDCLGDDSILYAELNWNMYGCFGSYDQFNPACDFKDCSLNEPCKIRKEN